MCLHRLSSEAYPNAFVGFTVKRKDGHGYESVHGGSRGLKQGWALRDEQRQIHTLAYFAEFKEEHYYPGVHAFVTLEDALAYTHRSEAVLKIYLRGFLAAGYLDELHVVVYREGTLVEEVRPPQIEEGEG